MVSAGVDLRDFVADVLHRCLEANLIEKLPKGCEAGYMLADALTDAGVRVSVDPEPTSMVLERPVLTIDPRRQFGRVCVGGSRIPAETLGEMVAAGDSVDELAEAYEVTRDEVLLACLWYQWDCETMRAKRQQRTAKAWREWALVASRVLGGWEPGPLTDPPDLKG